MKITTHTFQLNKKEYFRILAKLYFQKRWWLFAMVIAMAGFIYFNQWDWLLALLMVIFAVLYPVISLVSLYFQVYSKKNPLSEYERYFVIHNKYLEGHLVGEDIRDEMNFSEFSSVIKAGGYYFLYITKNKFLYIPETAFKSGQDRKWFDQLLKDKGLIK